MIAFLGKEGVKAVVSVSDSLVRGHCDIGLDFILEAIFLNSSILQSNIEQCTIEIFSLIGYYTLWHIYKWS